jgi:hypothetical protein
MLQIRSLKEIRYNLSTAFPNQTRKSDAFLDNPVVDFTRPDEDF